MNYNKNKQYTGYYSVYTLKYIYNGTSTILVGKGTVFLHRIKKVAEIHLTFVK